MDFNAVLLLAAVWFLVSLLSRGSRKRKAPPGQVSRDPLRPKPLPTTPDATQREGFRLELVLRDFQRALEQAQSAGRSGGTQIPEEEDVEERASLEVEPDVRSLEGEVRRADRTRVDQDDEAEQIEARRIAAAAARDATRTRADHAAFDERIRQEPADHTASSRYTAQQLRDAMVWREILGPPVSER